jgi:DNA-binding NarL/FixJ family response regulator
MPVIRIAAADDQKTFRQSLVRAINFMDGLEVVAEAGNGKELIGKLDQVPVDVIMLDLNMPEMDGISATLTIRDRFPELKIIILSQYDDDSHIIHLVESGAHAYLTKNAELEEIEAAIRAVHDKGFYFNDRVNLAMINRMARNDRFKASFDQNAEFTEIELQVLKLICREKNSQEIAALVYRSARTVEGIRQRMLDKVGAKNIAGLVLFAIRNNLIRLEEFQ